MAAKCTARWKERRKKKPTMMASDFHDSHRSEHIEIEFICGRQQLLHIFTIANDEDFYYVNYDRFYIYKRTSGQADNDITIDATPKLVFSPSSVFRNLLLSFSKIHRPLSQPFLSVCVRARSCCDDMTIEHRMYCIGLGLFASSVNFYLFGWPFVDDRVVMRD